MSSVVIAGNTSGSVTLSAPDVAGTTTLTLPATSGTVMVNGAAFSAYQSTAQTALAANTFTKLLFQTEEFDTNNNFASSTFTPSVAGYYQINGALQVNGTTNAIQAAIYKNGSLYKGGTYISPSLAGTLGFPLQTVSSIVFLNGSTDYVELYGFTVASLAPLTGIASTYFNGVLVRSA
jgi:hypothetical protein